MAKPREILGIAPFLSPFATNGTGGHILSATNVGENETTSHFYIYQTPSKAAVHLVLQMLRSIL